MTEETLAGGNMEPVVKVGDTVRRIAGPWSPAVHALLNSLRDGGVVEAPRPLGFDETGREVLTFLPGTMLNDAAGSIRWSETVLEQSGELLRRFHDAGETLGLDGLEWRSPSHDPVEVVCHNDFAPYNLVVRGDRVVGIIDVDMASPGPRIWDLAYLAYRLVPFAEDADPDAPAGARHRFGRLRRLIDAYGIDFASSDVLAVAADRLHELADYTDRRAAETGRRDLEAHSAMYRRDTVRLRGLAVLAA